MTFSIVAWDPNSDPSPEWGVAVASKFLAVGAAVPWARANAGAIATQATANLAYGPDGLRLLAAGISAPDVVRRLTEPDEDRAHRQLGVVDSTGGAASFTGAECFEWAGGVTGEGYCCQGNILAGPEVVASMANVFESTGGDLATRLLAGLRAGDDAGGDRRGRQSAALYVAREGGGYGGSIDRAVDLRVEDHPDPVPELERLIGLQRLYFPRPADLEFVDIDDALGAEITDRLLRLGYRRGLEEALFAFMGTENLEERAGREGQIERRVLDFLRQASSPPRVQ